ncbi:DUF6283 family protein [Microbacterium maritypicum]|uniref:Uncharacterized protein n=1 Tax=Microbacterium maritypicum MF109 TaxID=1333857 RepID=T5KE32_MICMQ|nr:DUF6283 family protein [Microbacterium liquefaciens]EQM74747.1 hypothetical protein L687_04605 [Microbacterium maritypicum MF109]
MGAASKPRRTPCASCPYRTAVASGIWHEEEYAKLERYDLDMADQPAAVFVCHQGTRDVCAGWLGHRDPADLLAVRLGVISGDIDAACLTYETRVPLFPSGAEAATHGRREIEQPGEKAVTTITKIIRVRAGSAEGPVQT